MTRSVALAFGIAVAVAAPLANAKPLALDRLIAFTDAESCTEARAFARLRDSLLIAVRPRYQLRLGKPVVPRDFAGAVGKPRLKIVEGVHEVTLPLNGSWRGLRATSLTHYAVEEGDMSGFTISFAAPKRAVLAAANEAGFALPPTGLRETGDGLTMTIAVDGNARAASLSCNIG